MALAALLVALAALLAAGTALTLELGRRRPGPDVVPVPARTPYVAHHAGTQAHVVLANGTAPVAPPWSLIPVGVSMFRLTNTDPLVGAFDVTVSAVCETASLYDPPKGVELGPGESVEFFGLTPDSENDGDTRVQVTWRRTPEGETQAPWLHTTG